MLLSTVYKTLEGAQRRAAIMKLGGKYNAWPVRLWKGRVDFDNFSRERMGEYTWKVQRVSREKEG